MSRRVSVSTVRLGPVGQARTYAELRIGGTAVGVTEAEAVALVEALADWLDGQRTARRGGTS